MHAWPGLSKIRQGTVVKNERRYAALKFTNNGGYGVGYLKLGYLSGARPHIVLLNRQDLSQDPENAFVELALLRGISTAWTMIGLGIREQLDFSVLLQLTFLADTPPQSLYQQSTINGRWGMVR